MDIEEWRGNEVESRVDFGLRGEKGFVFGKEWERGNLERKKGLENKLIFLIWREEEIMVGEGEGGELRVWGK